MTHQSSKWAMLPGDLLTRVFQVYSPGVCKADGLCVKQGRHRRDFQRVFRLVCSAWCTAAGQTVTKARGSHPAALATMRLHMPGLLTLDVRGCGLQCEDFDVISRFPQLQHLTYVAEHSDLGYETPEDFDPNQHCLFAASGFSSPFKGLTNLVSLHIEEEIPNVTPEELQPISLLSHLTRLVLHTATYKPATRSSATEVSGIMSSMTSAVYRSLGCLPNLSCLSVDCLSDHITKLQRLQSLNCTRCGVDWEIPKKFSCLTNLTELYIGHGRMTLRNVHYLPCLAKATFSIDASGWEFLSGLTTVRDLTLRRCRLSNVAFGCLTNMTQLTSLDFSMSYPIKGGLDYECIDHLSTLTALVNLHGKFVSRYGAEDPYALCEWLGALPLADTTAEHNVELKLHQVPRDSDWTSDFDGSVSCVSGSECENCHSLLGDLAVFDLQSSIDSDEGDMYFSDEGDMHGVNDDGF